GVVEFPRSTAEVVPGQRDVAGCGRVAEVDDHELAGPAAAPAPDDQVLPRVVPRPADSPAELPRTVPEDVVAERRQQLVVELVQVEIRLLVGPAGEEDRQLNGAALELALVDEPRAGIAPRGTGGARGVL